MREILGVLRFFLGIFEKTKEKKDRESHDSNRKAENRSNCC